MNIPGLMRTTLLALIPGFLAYCWFYGPGVAINVVISMATAIATEGCLLKLRALPLHNLLDATAALTGALLGLCLPPLLPLWMIILAVVFAVIFGKHLYGGTGQNVFNPAMVGFAVLIVSFPLAMSQWPISNSAEGVIETINIKLSFDNGRSQYDGITAATPLDLYKFRSGTTNEEFFAVAQVHWQDWAMINLAFLLGGLYLLYRKIIPWQTPAALLGTLFVLALLFYDSGSSQSLGSPLFHLFSGATMLAAFFIITDPVTCPGYHQGLFVFGIGVGLITFIIRTIGAYPEGIAFAVLLMNAASPLIDHVFSLQKQPA